MQPGPAEHDAAAAASRALQPTDLHRHTCEKGLWGIGKFIPRLPNQAHLPTVTPMGVSRIPRVGLTLRTHSAASSLRWWTPVQSPPGPATTAPAPAAQPARPHRGTAGAPTTLGCDVIAGGAPGLGEAQALALRLLCFDECCDSAKMSRAGLALRDLRACHGVTWPPCT